MEKTKPISAAALFSGIGGFCLGFKDHNVRTDWAVEFDEHATATYERNLPGVRVVRKNNAPADIRQVSVKNDQLNPVDVLHAGFPCQSFSQAGNRKGFDDERGKLFFELIRIVKEFGEDRPKIIVLENSPYLKYGDNGKWIYKITSELRSAGYWFRSSNCAEIDLYDHSSSPQKRNRLFMVALSTNRFKNGRFTFPEAVQPQKNLPDFIDFQGEKGEDYYLSDQNRYHNMILKQAKDRQRIYQLRKYTVRVKERDVCPTLTANMGQGGHNVPFVFDKKGLRKLTENECLGLQGFPENFEFPDSVPRFARYVQIGNSVSPKVAAALAAAVRRKLEEA